MMRMMTLTRIYLKTRRKMLVRSLSKIYSPPLSKNPERLQTDGRR
ncbi:unnamed protein product [Tenebrio molitor]|nr:unnamed protein product [Tenebrio molitor]